MDVGAAVETLYRSDWGRIVATLIRLVGDFDLAEEVVQEAFAAAEGDDRDRIRQAMVGIFTELGTDHPLAREHRRRLTAALY